MCARLKLFKHNPVYVEYEGCKVFEPCVHVVQHLEDGKRMFKKN